MFVCIFDTNILSLQPLTHRDNAMLLLLSILFQLDTAVVDRQQYIHAREQRIAATTAFYNVAEGKKKYYFARQLYAAYEGFDNDSALFYAEQSLILARHYMDAAAIQRATISRAQCMAMAGNYRLALEQLLPMRDHILPEVANPYYKALNLTYIWQAEFTTVQAERDIARQQILPLRACILQTETDPVWYAQESALIRIEDSPREALNLLLPVYDQLADTSNYVRYLANTLGSCYQRLYWSTNNPVMQDSALLYFAQSALCDMQHGVMEHASLREVALILFRKGDVERAYQYMNCCIQDADQSKARLRTVEMAGDMPLILNTYRQKIQEQQHKQHILIISLGIAASILVLVSFVLMLIMTRWRAANRQLSLLNTQLQDINQRLSVTNAQLQDSNRIRDAYVTRYMTECSHIIETMSQYHKTLLRASLSNQPKNLFQIIKSTEVIDRTLHEFYRHFDETFLSLFPHFVTDFNALLRPEEQFSLPQQRYLSTELRIFALIRLGISDSEDIAHFLRLSVKTVYNYRTQTRNRAIGNRDTLEQAVMHIGL